MNVNGIGAGYPAWRDKERTQRNGSGTGFAGRMADMVGANADSRKTNAVSRRDNYVGGNAADIYGIGVMREDQMAIQKDAKTGIDASNSHTWLSKINSAKLLDNDMAPFDYFGRSNKGNSVRESNKEINRTDREEKTETNIIVKPDGSRVLVVTMSIGGMETTMSLEISKPTETPTENAKQDTNNTPTAENDTVSDGMSNISSEA